MRPVLVRNIVIYDILATSMLSTLKPITEKALQPLARLLRNVNPNAISLLGLVFPIIFFVLVMHELYIAALVVFIFNAVDLLDGLVARAQNKVTAFGGFLDSTIDRFADFVVIAVFGFAGLVGWNIVMPLILCTYLISYIRSRTELAAKGKLVASVGIMERTERLVMIFIGLALYAVWPHVLLAGYNILAITLILITALSVITIAQRVEFAYRKL